MANYYVGDIIRDYFTVLDANDIPIAGLTATLITTVVDGVNTFMGVTEVGGGTYYVQFTPTVSGNYYYLLSVDSVPVQYFENNFDVEGEPEATVTGLIGSGTTTLADLVYATATECGDLRVLVATQAGAGDGSSFIDNVRGSAMPSEFLRGANAWVATPDSANYWHETRVTAYNGQSQVFSVQPNFPVQVQPNEVVWVTNLGSKGYWRQQYIDSINTSVQKYAGVNDVPLNYTYNGFTYGETVDLTKPAALTKLYGLTIWGYDDNTPYSIPMSPQNNPDKPGWSYDYATGIIKVKSFSWIPREIETLRILGFGPEPALVNPTDTTRMRQSTVVPDAAARLMRGKGDPRLLANAAQTQNMADTWFPSSIVQYPPGTISVA